MLEVSVWFDGILSSFVKDYIFLLGSWIREET